VIALLIVISELEIGMFAPMVIVSPEFAAVMAVLKFAKVVMGVPPLVSVIESLVPLIGSSVTLFPARSEAAVSFIVLLPSPVGTTPVMVKVPLVVTPVLKVMVELLPDTAVADPLTTPRLAVGLVSSAKPLTVTDPSPEPVSVRVTV
jgi:hypothetical protein